MKADERRASGESAGSKYQRKDLEASEGRCTVGTNRVSERDRQKEKASSNSITLQEQAPHNDHLNPLSDLTAIQCILNKRTGHSVVFFLEQFLSIYFAVPVL